MLEISPSLHIPEDELHFSFARSSGPGGQNVNKVASKALLRWNPGHSSVLPPPRARTAAQALSHPHHHHR